MIDFKNSAVFKLRPIEHKDIRPDFHRFLVKDEVIFAAFKTVRDQLVFTNKRVISANVQGVTGSKVDYTTLPFSKVQAFSIETSGTFDMDCELELYLSSIGKCTFEIRGSFDIIGLNKLLSDYILD